MLHKGSYRLGHGYFISLVSPNAMLFHPKNYPEDVQLTQVTQNDNGHTPTPVTAPRVAGQGAKAEAKPRTGGRRKNAAPSERFADLMWMLEDVGRCKGELHAAYLLCTGLSEWCSDTWKFLG